MATDLHSILLSLSAGLVSTGVMTVLEIPFWKKWGLTGILEWHENQVLTRKFFRFKSTGIYFRGIFFLHFLNGSLGGIGLLLTLMMIPSVKDIYLLPFGLSYGFFLWIITLIPIHKPITGIDPWKHPLGKGPAILSLLGHIIYSIILVTLFMIISIY